ncbi:MAG: ferrous iron transport protein B [Bacilli bacterium]|nr:ferrous iron transport protein B [Bacilli bacterium]
MKIALAGNPNVGKSTVFNALTGMHQHTGNWIGKTVTNAMGYYLENKEIQIYDLPGTYSLNSSSKEEELARNFICFQNIDACVVVCDATCLERNLNLLLQIMEINDNVVLCVNMMDEAKKKGIKIDLDLLSNILSIPVIGIIARNKTNLNKIINSIPNQKNNHFQIKYPETIEESIEKITPLLKEYNINKKWLALKLISNDTSFKQTLQKKYPSIKTDKLLNEKILEARNYLYKNGINENDLNDIITSTILETCQEISKQVVIFTKKNYNKRNHKIDKILTNKTTGIPIMIIGLLLIFWITIKGANYPSSLLFNFFNWLEPKILNILNYIHIPNIIISILINGIYRVLTWVISVMLPPMAIFFPIFTLLEDVGYLPRVAFTLDNSFRKCKACGKQGLTMAMGFGCNAVGVTGSRIIDSKRERLISILTNVFMPCNGRFPTIIMLISMFFVSTNYSSITSSLILTLFIILALIITFIVSYVLSKTILKGEPSSFILELPPYRRPIIIKTIIRSIFDRTYIVLKKAIKISTLAGIIIWLLANININDTNIINILAKNLNSIGKILGLDGAILVGFILGFPANEIVFPIILMIYSQTKNMVELPNLDILKQLLVENNFTTKTALCMILFCLFHYPCSTTCLTIYDETKSIKWTSLSIIIPTIIGIILCTIVNLIM